LIIQQAGKQAQEHLASDKREDSPHNAANLRAVPVLLVWHSTNACGGSPDINQRQEDMGKL
jgi:hypothetical protein